jgi:hypothetical protein
VERPEGTALTQQAQSGGGYGKIATAVRVGFTIEEQSASVLKPVHDGAAQHGRDGQRSGQGNSTGGGGFFSLLFGEDSETEEEEQDG